MGSAAQLSTDTFHRTVRPEIWSVVSRCGEKCEAHNCAQPRVLRCRCQGAEKLVTGFCRASLDCGARISPANSEMNWQRRAFESRGRGDVYLRSLARANYIERLMPNLVVGDGPAPRRGSALCPHLDIYRVVGEQARYVVYALLNVLDSPVSGHTLSLTAATFYSGSNSRVACRRGVNAARPGAFPG